MLDGKMEDPGRGESVANNAGAVRTAERDYGLTSGSTAGGAVHCTPSKAALNNEKVGLLNLVPLV